MRIGPIDRRRLLVLGSTGALSAACGRIAPGALATDAGGRRADGTATGEPHADSDAVAAADDAAEPSSICFVGPTFLGSVHEFARDTWSIDRINGVIVGRDARSIFANTAHGSHEGCFLNPPDANGLASCPCHAPIFDGNGAVLTGPATRPLIHFAVSICGGGVYLDRAMEVSAEARTPVVEAPAPSGPMPNACTPERIVDRSTGHDSSRMVMVPTSLNPGYDVPCIGIAAGQSVTFMFDLSAFPLSPGVAPGCSGDPPGTLPSPIETQTSGEQYAVVFPAPGIKPFYCPAYEAQGMPGVVVVR